MPSAHIELIARLNAVLKNKLTGINQYFLHARMLKHMGNVKLADYEFKSSIDIMKHSDMLVEHILTLGGAPDLQELSRLRIGETVSSMLENDLALSQVTLADIRLALDYSESIHSDASSVILRKIYDGQQEQIDFIRVQLAALQTPVRKDVA